MSPLPRETMTEQNYQRWARGLPPVKEVQPVKEDPVPPVVPDQIRFEDLPDLEIKDISCRPKNARNSEKVLFCGYDVWLMFENKKEFTGWMGESDFEKLRRKVPEERSDLKKKISF